MLRLLFLLILLTSTPLLHSAPPYPPSGLIEGVEFDFTTHQRLAPGSDNWPTTWADDDAIYTAWGDGGGFGGTNGRGRVALGVARVNGEPPRLTAANVSGGFQAEHPAPPEGKSYGILSVRGTLWMWVAGQPNPHLAECRLLSSRDHGATWVPAAWSFRFADGLTVPTFLQFGRDYAGARDEYVYSYFVEPQWGLENSRIGRYGFDVHRPGRLHLARVPVEAIDQRARYEFFAGREADGSARWNTEISRKQPIFEDANGVGWNLSVSWHPALRRYLLATEHTATHAGNLGLFDAPSPWGPWSTVTYVEGWGAPHVEASAFYWNFPTKWLSPDGTRFVLVFSGKNTNDSWNTVAGQFRLRH